LLVFFHYILHISSNTGVEEAVILFCFFRVQ